MFVGCSCLGYVVFFWLEGLLFSLVVSGVGRVLWVLRGVELGWRFPLVCRGALAGGLCISVYTL